MDGPVGAGTTTQAEYWQRFFESWIISFGGCMRSISYVANLNNYTPQEVIQAAQSGNLHFSFNETVDGRVFNIASSVPGKQFSTQIPDNTGAAALRTVEVSTYTSQLNEDPTKSVEKVVVKAIQDYSNQSGGIAVEGRNTAITINQDLLPSQAIGAYFFDVSDDEAIRRSQLRLRAQKKKLGLEPTQEELEAEAANVIQRNERDRRSGILLTASQALNSGHYRGVYNTNLAHPY